MDIAALGDVGRTVPDRRDLESALGWFSLAAEALSQHRFDDARQAVLRLRALQPGAKWVGRAADDLKTIDDKLMSLLAGPLCEMLEPGLRPARTGGEAGASSPALLEETVALQPTDCGPSLLPDALWLLVDGGGSFLLNRGQRVSIGRAASSHPADVPIYSDLAERHADVARVEDDYFLFSQREVQVNGTPTRQALLQDGDRVLLARNAKFTLRLPSRRSASAVLDLSDRVKMPNDVRRVILFSGHALIGAGRTAHVPCAIAGRNLVLFERAGKLWIRAEERGGGQEPRPVPIGESVEVDGVSFVIKPWKVSGIGFASR
jgi:hypothetical protein